MFSRHLFILFSRLRGVLCGCGLALGLCGVPCSGTAAELPPGVTSEPLARPTARPGATLFATLPPDQTGINAENLYADPKMWREYYREFSLGAIGTGVAIGDYDDDGRPDIFVVRKTETNCLFRNLGDWKFEDVSAAAGVAGPGDAWQQGAAFVDVNNDGRLDLYVARFNAPNLLYVNQGDGAFQETAAAAGLALKDGSTMGAWADYDRDGWLDVYVQTNLLHAEARPNGQRDRLFHNNRDGTFTDVTDGAGIKGDTQGHSATWWDYDSDGWPDLYVANDFKDPDTLYRNLRNGKFENVLSFVVPHTPQSSMGADLGDVDNDGRLDLLVADMAATTRAKDVRGMADLRAGAVEDLKNPLAAPQVMRNALFLNTGTPFCREAAHLTGLVATDWTWSLRFEDFDNDGRVDLHVTNGMVREMHNSDLVDRMMGTERIPERISLMKASPRLDEANLAFRNRGDLQFESVGAAWGLDHIGVSFGTATGDLDGDGDLDLVFANYGGQPTVCRNDSDAGHRMIIALRGAANRFGIGATVRIESATAGVQVRQLVIARGYNSSSEPISHFGLGDDDHIARLTVVWPDGREQVLSDLPADRRYTIAEPNETAATDVAGAKPANAPTTRADAGQFTEVGREAGLRFEVPEKPLDESAQQPLLPWRLNRLGPAVAIADLDGDGGEDVVVGGAMGAPPQMARAFGSGRFLPELAFAFDHPTSTADAGVLLFDADGDGDQDLLIAKGGNAKPAGDAAYQPNLWLNDGRGRFAAAPANALPELHLSAGPIVAADYNRDGRLDVFLGGRVTPGRYPTMPQSVLLENRGGSFVDVTRERAPRLATPGMVHAALWTDADDDGWMDLLLALEWGGVRFFRNVEGQRFSDDAETAGFAASGSGWWHSLAAADFNGDGLLDYVAGNAGLNTPYSASARHPAVLLAGEFDSAAGPQIVEAAWDQDTLFPLRGRKRMLNVFPSLRTRFPTFASYGKATLEEIFSANAIAEAQRLEVTELQSGVFLSRREAAGVRWQFSPLPRIAQVAPIYGVAAGDFDGDGRADIYAVQNFHSPMPETGRFDGGLSQLLRGDGRGGFSAVAPGESGLLVRRDAKGLAVFDPDHDGWPDFFITRNNDETLLYRNRGVAGRKSFAVSLRGAKENVASVGARVTLVLADNSTQSLEIAAGTGYLSQSTPAAFFGYPESNPPREIRVRWPDGANSVHPWTSYSPRVELAAPGR